MGMLSQFKASNRKANEWLAANKAAGWLMMSLALALVLFVGFFVGNRLVIDQVCRAFNAVLTESTVTYPVTAPGLSLEDAEAAASQCRSSALWP